MKALGNVIRRFATAPAALLLLLLVLMAWAPAGAEGIGEQARERAEEVAAAPKDVTTDDLKHIVNMTKTVGAILVILVLGLLAAAARLIRFDPFKRYSANTMQAGLLIAFGVAFFAYLLFDIMEYKDIPNVYMNSASEHGLETDLLFHITIAITMFALVAVHVLLIYYTWRYRGRPGNVALFYPDNHKLELLWTVIPALGLVVLVGYGSMVWYNIFHPKESEGALEIELCAEQFQWRIRYPGKDGKLGKHQFRLISDDNPVGVDPADRNSADDVVPKAGAVKELHIPKGRMVKLHIRSKDVLHGVFMPHFRVNMYAVPGMPTTFYFKPIKTTEEYRKDVGNPKFNYEMACSQLCGVSHFNMRVVIVVEDQAKVDKWLAEQPTVELSDTQLTTAKR